MRDASRGSCAFLAYLRDKAGADTVKRALWEEAAICAPSLAEVLSRLTEAGEDPDRVMDAITGCRSASFRSTRTPPLRAGGFAGSPRAGVSVADRACLALGRRLGRAP